MKNFAAVASVGFVVGLFVACAAETNEQSLHQASLTLTKGGASPTGRYTGDYRVDFRGRRHEVEARVGETASTLERLALVPGEKLVVAKLSDGTTTRAYGLSAEAARQISDVTSGFSTPPQSASGPDKVGAIKQALTKNECEACGGSWVGQCAFGFDSECSWACLICTYECVGADCLNT